MLIAEAGASSLLFSYRLDFGSRKNYYRFIGYNAINFNGTLIKIRTTSM